MVPLALALAENGLAAAEPLSAGLRQWRRANERGRSKFGAYEQCEAHI